MVVTTVHAQAIKNPSAPPTKVEFTAEQKQQLSDLYQEIFSLKKEVMDKYVEYGAIPKEKADKIKSWMDKHYQKLEENGFQPMHRDYHHHHQKDKAPPTD